MANDTTPKRILERRIKQRKLPSVETPETGMPEVDRALQSMGEHLRMFAGDSQAPKERFVSLEELEQAGIVQLSIQRGFASIAGVFGEPVQRVASTNTSAVPTSSGDGGGGGGSPIPKFWRDLDDVDDSSRNTWSMAYFDGSMWQATADKLEWHHADNYLQFQNAHSVNWLTEGGVTYEFLDFLSQPGGDPIDIYADQDLSFVTHTADQSPEIIITMFQDAALVEGDSYLFLAECGIHGTNGLSAEGRNGNRVSITYNAINLATCNFTETLMSQGNEGERLAGYSIQTAVPGAVVNVQVDSPGYASPNIEVGAGMASAFCINLTKIGAANYKESVGTGASSPVLTSYIDGGAQIALPDADGVEDYLLIYQMKGDCDSRFTELWVALTGGPFNGLEADQEIWTHSPEHNFDKNYIPGSQRQTMGMQIIEAPAAGTIIKMRTKRETTSFGPDANLISSSFIAIKMSAFSEYYTDFLVNITDPLNAGEHRNNTINFTSASPDGTQWLYLGGLHDYYPSSGFWAQDEINHDVNTTGDVVVSGDQQIQADGDTTFRQPHVTYPRSVVTPITLDLNDAVEATYDVLPAPNSAGEEWGASSMAAIALLTGTQETFTVGNVAWKTLILGTEVEIDSTLDVTGATALESTLAVTGAATFDDTVTTEGITTVNAQFWVNSIANFLVGIYANETAIDQTSQPGKGQYWVQDTAPNSPRYTDAGDRMYALNSVFEAVYSFDTILGAVDPGVGDIRFDNATPASVTNLYISDTDDIGWDYSWILDNLATDDLITIKSESDDADYAVFAVSGAPTDNTGWWTIPVTVINSGTLPAEQDQVRIGVQKISALATVFSLDDLSDVDLTGAADNDMLFRSGGVWIDTGGALQFDGTDLIHTGGNGTGFRSSEALGPIIVDEPSSESNPTLVPNREKLSTGIGGGSSGSTSSLFLIVSSQTAVKYEEVTVGNILPIYDHDRQLTASVTQTQGQQTRHSGYSIFDTVANDGDTMTLTNQGPDSGAVQYVLNQGANNMQIFPSTSWDLGAGVNNPVTIGPGEGRMWMRGQGLLWHDVLARSLEFGITDVDLTGAADNDMLFRSGGNWTDTDGLLTWDGAQLIIAVTAGNHQAAPSLAFGDGNTGWYENVDNQLTLSQNGVGTWTFGSSSLDVSGSSRTSISTAARSLTVPTYRWSGDTNTGIGGSDDNLAFISGGIAGLMLNESLSGVLQIPAADLNITAFAGGGIGNAHRMVDTYNIITTCASPGDSVKLHQNFRPNSLMHVYNATANACDVFPDNVSDDLGQGLGVAVSLAAGDSISFIATVVNSTWTEWKQSSTAAAASAFNDLTDVDLTGAADNDMLFRSGGNWIDTAGLLTWDGATLEGPAGTATDPSVAFGEANTGFYRPIASAISATLGGVQRWSFQATQFSGAGDGAVMMYADPSATTPSLRMRASDADTGLGQEADEFIAIAGGVTGMRFKELNSGVIQVPDADVAITAFATGGQASATQLDKTYNVIGTVATTADSVKLPPTFLINSVVFVKNDGANAADIFPATGDDLGAGLNLAVSIPAGESKSFIATAANATWTELIVSAPGAANAFNDLTDGEDAGRATNDMLWFDGANWTDTAGQLKFDGSKLEIVHGVGDVFTTNGIHVDLTNQAGFLGDDFGITVYAGGGRDIAYWDDTGLVGQHTSPTPYLIMDVASSNTQPVYSFGTDQDTGIGGNNDDTLSAIVGTIEGTRWSEVSSHVLQKHSANVGLTADVGSAQGNGVILSSYNQYSTVGTAGDAATLPATFGAGEMVYVKNDGANAMDVFPATGDTITPLAINIAFSLAAGRGVWFMGTAASATWSIMADPDYAFDDLTDLDLTGAADNDMLVRSGGSWIDTAGLLTWDGSQMLFPQEDVPLAPTIAFGDGDTGIFERTDDLMYFVIATVEQFRMSAASGVGEFKGLNTNGAMMRNLSSSATVPSLCPRNGDINTGHGNGAADSISTIAGGVTAVTYAESLSAIRQSNNFDTGITASTTQTQGQEDLVSSYSEVSTVANDNDVVTAFRPALGMRMIIINNGANILQVFPDSTDDLGAGTDNSITIAPGDFLEAIGMSATVWNVLYNGPEKPNTVKSEVVTTTNVILPAETGTTFYLDLAGGFTSTLPAPAAGLKFRFVVKTAPTTAYIITTDSGANILYGTINEITTTAGISVQAQDTLNFVASTSLIGDWVEFESDGTNWYLHGAGQVDDGITVSVT